MSVPTFLTVASGFAVSSAFSLSRADHALAVEVPSGVAGGAGLQFATSSGGTTWLTLSRLVGSGLAWAACSGAAGGCVRIPTKPNGWSDRRRTPNPSEAEHLVRAKANSPTGAP